MNDQLSKTIPEEKEVHFLDYLIVIAKHSRKIIFTSAAVTVLAYIFFLLGPNQYICKASLLPPQQNLTMIGQLLEGLGGGKIASSESRSLGGAAASLLGLQSSAELYVGMIKSDTVCDQIIERFHLRQIFGARYQEQARERLLSMAKITISKEGFIVINVTDGDRERVAALTNAFIEEFDKLLHNLSSHEASNRLDFLEKMRAQSSHNLAKAEEALRNFSEKSSVLQLDTQTQSTLRYIAELRAAIDTKEVQIQVLRQQATPSNYDVIRMETELKGMKEKLQAAESQCELTTMGNVCLNTSQVPTLGLDYVRLFRELKFQEGLYQLYNKMSEIARLDMLKDVAVVQVIDKAEIPETRSNRRLKPALFVGVVTFALMILFSFVLERARQMKDQREESRRIAELKSYLKPWGEGLAKLKNLVRLHRWY